MSDIDRLIRVLRSCASADVSDAIEALEVRPRTEGFADRRLRCVVSTGEVLVGHALTIRADSTSSPPPLGGIAIGTILAALDELPTPRVVVVEEAGPASARGLAAGGFDWWAGLGAGNGRRGVLRSRAGALKGRWRATYEADVLRLQVMASVLELRCGDALTRPKRRALRWIRRMDESAAAFTWLALRGLLPGGPGNVTLGAERKLAGGILWRRLSGLAARGGGGRR